MTTNGVLQLVLYLVLLIGLAKPLGWYMARVYQGRACGLDRLLGPAERFIYRLAGIKADQEQGWKSYTIALLVFNALGILVLYSLHRRTHGPVRVRRSCARNAAASTPTL